MFTILFYIFLRIFISIIFCSRPITLGIWIFLRTFNLSLFISIFYPSWFSILLFLIYIGGLLVIFAYFITIEPNQHLEIIKIISITRFTNIFFYSLYSLSNITPIFLNPITYPPSLRSLLSINSIFILFFLVIILFLALIIVVKITYKHKAPLRPFSYVLPSTKIKSYNKNYK